MSSSETRIGNHQRVPWTKEEPDTIRVHCRLDELKGTFKADKKQAAENLKRYSAAKNHNDRCEASNIVDSLIDEQILDEIVDAVIASGKPGRVVFPHPEFDAGNSNEPAMEITNALPFAIAAYVAEEVGGDIETNIVESARPGRTKLNRIQRFLWQPRFVGEIDTEVAYILLDDNCSTGGTFAMLRSHIVANAGTVIFVSSLSVPNGKDQRFSVADSTVRVLLSRYGTDLGPFWIQEIGHDIRCLTEGEGSHLASWEEDHDGDEKSLLQRLRDRFHQAKSTGK